MKGLKGFQKGRPPYNIGKMLKGRKLTSEHKKKISLALKGKKPKNFDSIRKLAYLNPIKGDKHYNWQGGKTKREEKLRNSLHYKLWRRSVMKRDNYICQSCFVRGGYLEVHHIIPFSQIVMKEEFDELWDNKNGVTLCVPCHCKIDKERRKFEKPT